MVQVTSPDNINKWTATDPTSIYQASQSQGDSVQTALNKRERYTYVWPTSAERGTETGMTQGSLGYQLDTKSEYIYDNSVWRLQLPYAQLNSAVVSAASSANTGFGTISIDSPNSTSTTFVTPSGGSITLVNPGVYALSALASASAPLGGVAYVFCTVGSNPSVNQLGRGPFASDNVAQLTIPFYNATAANTQIYFWYYQQTGGAANISAIVRVGRLG